MICSSTAVRSQIAQSNVYISPYPHDNVRTDCESLFTGIKWNKPIRKRIFIRFF